MIGTHWEEVQIPLSCQLNSCTRNGLVFLEITKNPERRHRARYQTEGSRGAVKDSTGIGHPIVALNGYNKPTKLQVFIGTGSGDVAPHPFYQACMMKNFTRCEVKDIEKTVVLEMDLLPDRKMAVICDCIGIVKQTNSDVQRRMSESNIPTIKKRKKSPNVRLVFRTTIMHPDCSFETIQIASEQIDCTQQLADPEVLTMSWRTCPANGGLELFMIGRNFSRDSRVVFYEGDGPIVTWRVSVIPIREYINQCHLVCIVPPYMRTDIVQPVQVRVVIECSGSKKSDPQPFAYTPVFGYLHTSPLSGTLPEPTDVLNVFLLEVRCKSEDFEYGEGIYHPILLWTSQSRDSQPSSFLEITESRPGCSTSTIEYSTSTIPPIALYKDRRRLTLPMQLMTLLEIKNESLRAKQRMAILRSQLIGASSSPERPSGEGYQVIPSDSAAIQTQPTPDQQRMSPSEVDPQKDDSLIMEHNKPRKMRKLRESRKKVVPSTSIPNTECTGSLPTIECSQQSQNILTAVSEYAVNPPTTDEQAVRSLDDFVNLAAESHLSGSQSHSSSSSYFTTPHTSPEKYSLVSPERKRKLPSPSDTVSTVVEETKLEFVQRVADMMFPFDESSSESSPVDTPTKQTSDPVQNYSTEQATQQIDYLNYPGGETYRFLPTPTNSPWTTSPSLSSSSSVILSPYSSPNKSADVSPIQTSPHSSPAKPYSTPVKGNYTSHQAAGTESQCSSPESISRPLSSMNLSTMQKATSTTQSTQESHLFSFHSNSPLQNDPNIREGLNMMEGIECSREAAEAGYSMSIVSALEIAEGGAEGYYTLPTTSSLIQSQFSSTSHVATNIPPTPMSSDPNTSFPQQVQAGIEEQRHDSRTSTPPLQQRYMQEVHTETSVYNECNIDYIPTFYSDMSFLPDIREELDEILGTEVSERTGADHSMGGHLTTEIATSGSINDNILPTPNPIQNTVHQPSMTHPIIHQSGYVQQDFPMSTGMNTQVSQTFFNQNEQLVTRPLSMEPGTTFSLLTYQSEPILGLQTPVPSMQPGQNEPDNTSTETRHFQRSSSMPNPNKKTEN